MAIAYDASSSVYNAAGATSHTLSHTCTGTNLVLVVSTRTYDGDSITGVTYGGVSMTEVGSGITLGADKFRRWILIAPSTGANDIVATLSSSLRIEIYAISLTGARQLNQPDSSATATGSSTSATGSVTTDQNSSWVVAFAESNGASGSWSSSTNCTVVQSINDRGAAGYGGPKTPSGSFTQAISISGTGGWGFAQVTIAPTGPTIRSQSTNSANNSTVTVTKPSGTVDGDYLVATVGTRNGTCSAPAGWTSVGEVTYDANRSTIFYRIASSEGASYIFTNNGGASGIAVGIVAITGADITTAPTYAGQSNASSSTCTAPTITPSASSLIMLVCSSNGFATGTSAQAIATSNPGLTERYEVHAPNNGGDGVSTVLATGVRPESTATGSGTATLSASEANAGQLVSIPAVLTLTDNLVAFYKLDESSGNAADSSGNGYTLTNRGTTTYGAALINNGADFGTPNTTKALNTSNSLGIDGGIISISGWVKLKAEIGSGVWSLINQSNFTTKTGYWFRYYYNSGTPRLEWERWRNNETDQNGLYTVSLGTSTWHHLVLTYNGSTVKGYLDGTERASFTASGNGSGATGGTAGFAISSSDGVSVSEEGDFIADAVGVWSRVLTTTEIALLYNGGVGVQYPFPLTVSFSVSDTVTASESTPTTTYIKRTDTFTLSEVIAVVKSVVFSVSDTVTMSSVITTTQGVLSRIIRPLIARIRRILPTSTRAKKQ